MAAGLRAHAIVAVRKIADQFSGPRDQLDLVAALRGLERAFRTIGWIEVANWCQSELTGFPAGEVPAYRNASCAVRWAAKSPFPDMPNIPHATDIKPLGVGHERDIWPLSNGISELISAAASGYGWWDTDVVRSAPGYRTSVTGEEVRQLSISGREVQRVLANIEQAIANYAIEAERLLQDEVIGKMSSEVNPMEVREPFADLRPSHPREIWVIYGQNKGAKDLIFAFLRSIDLIPRDFSSAEELTQSSNPYIGDVLKAAFARVSAVLVILGDDEQVELRETLRQPGRAYAVEYQARPNVYIEAGMALATHPGRTILIEMGRHRKVSDLSGMHAIRWGSGGPEVRQALIKKLAVAGSALQQTDSAWMFVGNEINLFPA